jgi:hypothetical protein
LLDQIDGSVASFTGDGAYDQDGSTGRLQNATRMLQSSFRHDRVLCRVREPRLRSARPRRSARCRHRHRCAVCATTGAGWCRAFRPTTRRRRTASVQCYPPTDATPMCSLRHDLRRLTPCFSTNHSPAPNSFNPVLSTNRCTGSVLDGARNTGSVSARRLSVEWSATARSRPSR